MDGDNASLRDVTVARGLKPGFANHIFCGAAAASGGFCATRESRATPVNRIFADNATTALRRGETRYHSQSHCRASGRIFAKNTCLTHRRTTLSAHLPHNACVYDARIERDVK